MLYDHSISGPCPRRPNIIIRRNRLPMMIFAVAAALFGAKALGVSLRWVWVGSTLLSGLVLSYTLFSIIRAHHLFDLLKKDQQ